MRNESYTLKLVAACTVFVLASDLGVAKVLAEQAQHIVPPASASLGTASASLGTADQRAQPQLDQRAPRYVIQLQDVLLLTFPLSTELNQTVTVQPDGYINLQDGGSVHAQGLTVPELVAAVKHAYKGILHDPIVNVDLEDFQKPRYTVSGQVGKPGQYELRAEITVAEALAVAGGMAPTAKTQVFLFHRTSSDWLQVKKINVKDILNGKNANEDPVIQPGDMIYVPEKFITNFRKYVPYTANVGTYFNSSNTAF